MRAKYDNYTSDDLTDYGTRLHINTIISVLVNILTIYCVLVHSTKNMNVYKWYLLVIQITTALFDLHMSLIFSPFPTFPIPGLCAAGIWSRRWGYVWGGMVQFILAHWLFSFQGLALVYGVVYRYQVISEKMEWLKTKWAKILMVLLPFICPIPAVTLLIMCISERDVTLSFIRREAPEMLELYTTEPCNSIVYSTTASLYYLMIVNEILIISSISTFFMYKTYDELRKKKQFLSEASFRMQKQLLISLIFQFFVPLICLISPIVMLYVMIFLNIRKMKTVSLIAFQIMTIHSSMNGWLMILTITPYRQAVINLLHCRTKTPINPSPQQKIMTINSHISGIERHK